MLKPIIIGTIPLPQMYVCDNRSDANLAKKKGLTYVIRPKGWTDDDIAKRVLWSWLMKKFPAIIWRDVLDGNYGKKKLVVHHLQDEELEREGGGGHSLSESMDMRDDGEYRESYGNEGDDLQLEEEDEEWVEENVNQFLEDRLTDVNMDELSKLGYLPQFISDNTDAIRRKPISQRWRDGWNKKLGNLSGSFSGSRGQAPNLIILDTSGSIPGGVATTMTGLIETLREQAMADLIITSGATIWIPYGSPMPPSWRLHALIGGSNECTEFNKILQEHVLGREWGNVIVFGDQDAPTDRRFRNDLLFQEEDEHALSTSTKVNALLCYHTYNPNQVPGYARWTEKFLVPGGKLTINTDWVTVMKDGAEEARLARAWYGV